MPGEVKDPTQGVNVYPVVDSQILENNNSCVSPSLGCLEVITWDLELLKKKWDERRIWSRIWDNQWTLHITSWKTYTGKWCNGTPARWWRDNLDKYWKGTIRQRLGQDKQMRKQHAEAFAQPWDTIAAKWWMMAVAYELINFVKQPHEKFTFDHSVG